MLKALIVDDERKSREGLKILIEDFCNNVEVIGLAASVDEALELIRAQKPELVFLDIQMNKETGFDLLKRVDNTNFEVIFTTAYSEYAIEAIKFSAVDYLLKPINIDQLKQAIEKASSKTEDYKLKDKVDFLIQNFKTDTSENFKLVLPSSEGLIFIDHKEILYCEASSNYTFFYLKAGTKILVSKTLKDFEGILSRYNFYRTHHSFLVNLKEIKKYVKGDGGYVVMSNDMMIEVSKRKKEGFLARIAQDQVGG